jgi:hypothetical protein
MSENPPVTIFAVLVRVYRRYSRQIAFVYRAAGTEVTVSYEKFFEDVLLLARTFSEKKSATAAGSSIVGQPPGTSSWSSVRKTTISGVNGPVPAHLLSLCYSI